MKQAKSKRAALEARLLEAEQLFVAREEEVRTARVAQAGRQAGRQAANTPDPDADPHPHQVRARLAASKDELSKAVETELGEEAVVAAEATLEDEFAAREEALEGKVGP